MDQIMGMELQVIEISNQNIRQKEGIALVKHYVMRWYYHVLSRNPTVRWQIRSCWSSLLFQANQFLERIYLNEPFRSLLRCA